MGFVFLSEHEHTFRYRNWLYYRYGHVLRASNSNCSSSPLFHCLLSLFPVGFSSNPTILFGGWKVSDALASLEMKPREGKVI